MTQWFKLIRCKKVKCAINFVRGLITNFLIRSLIWKIDKTRIYLEWCNTPCIGIYSGLFGITCERIVWAPRGGGEYVLFQFFFFFNLGFDKKGKFFRLCN